MGWTEIDDDNGYEITEDEVKEFENLCHQMKLNKVINTVHCYNWFGSKLQTVYSIYLIFDLAKCITYNVVNIVFIFLFFTVGSCFCRMIDSRK